MSDFNFGFSELLAVRRLMIRGWPSLDLV